MAEVRTALLEFLERQDDSRRNDLAGSLDEIDLAEARRRAKDDPGSSSAAASVLGRMLVDGAPPNEIVEAAKALAQRAPRDQAGTDVALLAGVLLWRVGGQPQLAEPYFRRVRRDDPSSEAALAFYRELFAGEAGASQLMQVLVQARRAIKEPERRFQLAAEMAELARDRLRSTDRAIEVWRSVIREDGHDPRASGALEQLYRAGEKWTALVELLKEEFDRIPEDPDHREQRIAKLLEIAELYRDRLRMETMALATLQRVLDIDPRHQASLAALADTYAKAGRWNDLLAIYVKRLEAAEAAGDRPSLLDFHKKIARIWVEELGNPQRALEPLGHVLELDPRDDEARTLLARIHEQRRDWRALIALRRQELGELTAEDALRRRVELAKLAEGKLGDRREAIAAWNEVIEHHGAVDEALDSLARLYERESRWASAAEVLRRKLENVEDRDGAVRLLTQIGSIYSDRLRQRDAALPIWEEVARIVPGHDKATRTLRDSYVALARWDDLTRLYERQGRVHDLVEVLQSAADRIAEVQERVDLYRRVADLCRNRLGEPERAVKALERTLAIQSDNLAVARELLPIYEEQSNWARLMSTYEVLLAAADNDDQRLEIIAALRTIAEHKLGSATLTLQWASRAYQLRPGDIDLREGLEGAAEQADGWDELTRMFELRVDDAGVSDDERLLLLDKLAVVARDRLFKPDDAQRYFRRIVELDPSNRDAMAALEEIYSSTRRWDDLAEVYRKRLQVTNDEQARLQTLRGMAKIQEEQLADLDGAVESHRGILQLRSDDLDALNSLARIHRNRGSWESLADVLQRILDFTGVPAGQVPLLYELGQIHGNRLREIDRAITQFLAVLERDPNHRQAVAALESLREGEPGASLPIMRGLLPYYRRVGDRVKEAAAMEVLIAAENDEETRLGQLEELAAIYEKMADRQRDALRIRRELFIARPQSWDNRQTFKRLGRELGHTDGVADTYREVLDGFAALVRSAEHEGRTLPREQAHLRRDLLLEYAAILRDDLRRPVDAERAFGEVLEQDETHQGAYEALEALLGARQAHSELVRLYRRRVDVVFNQREQKELLSRIIELTHNVLGDRSTAVATAEELLDLIPDDIPTIELLAAMYEAGGERRDREQLEELLGRWAELVADDASRHELLCRRAMLRIQYLGDAFGAVDLLGRILAENPDHAGSRRLLEELLDISDVQLQVCSLLEPIYGRLGDHRGRIRVLQVRRNHAEASGSIDEAVTHLLEITRVEEQELGSRATAFEAVRQAYAMDPRRQDTRNEVQRLGLALGREQELVELWRSALSSGRILDKAQQVDLGYRIAQLLDERIKDAEAARRAYADLLALDPADARIAHGAIEALCRLHMEAGDGMALVEAKLALLRFTDSTAEQVRIRLDIAEIQEQQLGDRVGAALTYSEVLDLQPDNIPALESLERLFLEEEEWERLCEVLEHRIGVTGDPRVRASLWRQVGEIHRDQLGDSQRAIAAFQSILDVKPGREETVYALRALVDLNQRLERWPDVEEGLRRLVALADADRERVDLLTRTGEVVGKRLGRGQDALDLLKRVLDLAPTDGRARNMVVGYLDKDDLRERATRILTPLYEAEQNWAALLELEELQARNQPSGRRRLQALLKVARTHEERLRDPARAFDVLCAAMAEAADQPELEDILAKVERLGAAPERADALLDAYSSTVDHILDADLQQRVLRNIGQVALERLGKLDGARAAYERVLELAPDDAQATAALEQIYVRQDDHESMARLLTRRADRAAHGPERDDLLIRAAEIHRTRLEHAEEAIDLYERLGADGLARPEVQIVLEPLYEATGRHRQLAAHLNRRLSRLQGKELVDTHLRLGRLYGEKLEDSAEGIRHLSTALRLDPDHAVATDDLNRYLEDPSMRLRVAEMLEPVFAAVQDWHRLIQIQEIRFAETHDLDVRGQILLKIAQLEEEQLEDLDRAFDSYVRLFKDRPTHRYVRDQLSRLANVLGQAERYAKLLTEYVGGDAATDDSDEVLEIVREAADLWNRALRNPAAAVPLYQRILLAKPTDPTVFPALESALTRAEMWRELVDVYWREADSALDEDRRVDVLRRLAQVAADVLEDPDEAARGYQRILELRPEHGPARSQLEGIYERTGRNAELLDLLGDRLARTDTPRERVGVYLRMAQVQDGPLDDPEGAVDSIDALLAENPGNPDGVAALENIAESRKSLRTRILPILRPIYENTGNIGRLIELDGWQLAVTEDPTSRHDLLREMAALHQKGPGGPEAAFRVLCRALAEPGPDSAYRALDERLESLLRTLQIPGALSEALCSAATAETMTDEVERRLSMLVKAARLQHDAGDPTQAVEILRRALEVSPEHGAALALMDECLVRLGSHEELRAVLERRVAISLDDGERVELLRRLARLLEDTLVRQADAERVWRDLLDIEPSDHEALRRLGQAYERSGSTTELVEVLRRQIDASADPAQRRELRMQLAGILREAMKDRIAEIDVLRDLLAEQATDDDAMAALARALIAEQRHAEAADVIQERAALAESDERKAALLLEAARIHAGPLADVAAALERYQSILELVGSQEGALADLVALSKDPDWSEQSADLAMPHLIDAQRWSDLATVLVARVDLVGDTEGRVGLLHELARVRLERLDDAAGALDARIRLLDVVGPDDLPSAMVEVERLAGRLDRIDDAVAAMGARSLANDRDPRARLLLAQEAARICEEIIGDRERALALLVPMLDGRLADRGVCERIERIARALGHTDLLVRALRECSTLVSEPTEHATVLVRLGEALVHAERTAEATDAYRDALDVEAGNPGAIAGLETILARNESAPSPPLLDLLDGAYQAVGNHTGQMRITTIRLAHVDHLERPRLLEHLALLAEEGAGRLDQALEAWGELLALDPDSHQALEHLIASARNGGLVPRAADLLSAAVHQAQRAGRVPATLGIAAATILLEDLGQGARAAEVAQWVLEHQPDHPEALDLLVRAARATRDPGPLHDALARSAGAQVNPEVAVELWREAASVAEQDLRDVAQAIRDLEQLLAIDEGHESAWQKLLGLLTAGGDYDRLATALGKRVLIGADVEERREHRYRLANVLVAKLERFDDAVAVYNDMIADRPDDLAALSELEVLLRRMGRWSDVRDILERRLDVARPDERIGVLEELARLAEEHLEDAVEAIERYQQMIGEHPEHRAAEEALERLLSAEERWDDLANLLEARMDRQADSDPEGHRTTASRLAALLAERLDDSNRAQSILGRLLELDPAYVPAILALAAVYEARGDEGAMRLTLQRAAQQQPSGEAGAQLELRLARLTDDPAQRRAHLERALQLDPSNAEAATALLEASRKARDWNQVVYLLELAMGRTTDETRRRAIVLERVDLMLDEIGDVDGALRVLAAQYEKVQDDIEINRRIADALFRAERYEEAGGMYNWLVEVGRRERKRDRKLAHDLTRMARIAMRNGGAGGAMDLLQEAYRIDTTNVETLIALGVIYERNEDWKNALKIYRTMLLQNADRSGLIRRGDLYASLARAHIALDEKPKALAMLRRGLEEDADHPELARQLREAETV